MSSIYRTSSAEVVRPASTRQVRIVEYQNPEVLLPPLFRAYFLEVGFADMYEHFSTVRVGSVHPFALLLFQEVQGAKSNLNLFPSITITDSGETETDFVMGQNHVEMNLTGADVEVLAANKTKNLLLFSDENLTRMRDATADDGIIVGKKVSIKSAHSIDVTIWGDNKSMVSQLYDLVRQFFVAEKATLHSIGIDIQSAISGRRSGDINVEFGKILYGASLTVPAVIDTSNMVIDVTTGIIAVVNPDPDFH